MSQRSVVKDLGLQLVGDRKYIAHIVTTDRLSLFSNDFFDDVCSDSPFLCSLLTRIPVLTI